MYDKDASGTINLNEFQQLFTNFNQWKQVFESYDKNKSGSIEQNELNQGKDRMLLLLLFFRFMISFPVENRSVALCRCRSHTSLQVSKKNQKIMLTFVS